MTGLLVDDDPLVAQTIEHFVEKSALVEECLHCDDATSAVNLLANRSFDFVLLDLHLPDLPGQALLEAVPANTPVIVVTSDPGFGAASYRFGNVVDYVVKPLDYLGFHRAVERAGQFAGGAAPAPSPQGGQAIFVKSGNEIVRLFLDEICFIKAEANYVSFHLEGEPRAVMTLTTLKHIAAELPGNFLRVHRSYIVNRDHIARIDGNAVHVGEAVIPIGESFRAGFLEKLGIIA